MKQFLSIFRFEYLNYVKKKFFIGFTAVFCVIVVIVFSFPRIAEWFQSSESTESSETVAVLDQTESSADELGAILKAAFPDADVRIVNEPKKDLRKKITDGKYDKGIILQTPLEYQYIAQSFSMYDGGTEILNELLTQKARADAMVSGGLSKADTAEIMQIAASGKQVSLGKDQGQNFMYTYILCMLLFMTIQMYGVLVATSIGVEKGSRTMEVLISCANPNYLVIGKVLGTGCAGLTQIFLLLAFALTSYQMNASYWEDVPMMASLFDMPVSIILYMVLFFLIGFFIYAFLYAAAASFVNSSDDINTVTQPIMLMFMAVFFAVIFSISSGNVNSPLIVVLSYIPLSSPMAMFVRIAMGEVAGWEIILSTALSLITMFIVIRLSATVYRMGVLMYGTKPSLKQIAAMIKTK